MQRRLRHAVAIFALAHTRWGLLGWWQLTLQLRAACPIGASAGEAQLVRSPNCAARGVAVPDATEFLQARRLGPQLRLGGPPACSR